MNGDRPEPAAMGDGNGAQPPGPELRPLENRLHDIHFRPIRPDDWHRLQLFHQRLSGATVELRFHGGKKALSVPLAHRFTQLEGTGDAAIVATTGTRGRIVGVARYCWIAGTAAEVAFVVEDGFQGHDVGGRLMQHLRDLALQNGITEFVADVLSGNASMFRLLEEAGVTQTRYDRGMCEVRVNLLAPR